MKYKVEYSRNPIDNIWTMKSDSFYFQSIVIGLSRQDALCQQRQRLRKRLGLDFAGGIDVGMEGLFDDNDLLTVKQEKKIIKQSSTEVSIYVDILKIKINTVKSRI